MLLKVLSGIVESAEIEERRSSKAILDFSGILRPSKRVLLLLSNMILAGAPAFQSIERQAKGPRAATPGLSGLIKIIWII
jgi:hypothetical protein